MHRPHFPIRTHPLDARNQTGTGIEGKGERVQIAVPVAHLPQARALIMRVLPPRAGGAGR